MPAAAETCLTEAFWVADASRHDEVRAEAAAILVYVVGYQQARFAEAIVGRQLPNPSCSEWAVTTFCGPGC